LASLSDHPDSATSPSAKSEERAARHRSLFYADFGV
jgi:hypothetical protein